MVCGFVPKVSGFCLFMLGFRVQVLESGSAWPVSSYSEIGDTCCRDFLRGLPLHDKGQGNLRVGISSRASSCTGPSP